MDFHDNYRLNFYLRRNNVDNSTRLEWKGSSSSHRQQKTNKLYQLYGLGRQTYHPLHSLIIIHLTFTYLSYSKTSHHFIKVPWSSSPFPLRPFSFQSPDNISWTSVKTHRNKLYFHILKCFWNTTPFRHQKLQLTVPFLCQRQYFDANLWVLLWKVQCRPWSHVTSQNFY